MVPQRFSPRAHRPILAAFAATALIAGGLALPAPAVAAPPAGMSRFVVSVGGLSAGSSNNWVRLANYSLTANGTVTESHFHWTQKRRVKRTSTGVRSGKCVVRNCVVRTANGYQATSAPEKLSGKYKMTGSVLRIDWQGGGGREEWTVSEPIAGKLAKLAFRKSSFKATHGFGYGSNANWNQRASMSQIAKVDQNKLEHEYHFWKTNSGRPVLDNGSGSPFWMRKWSPCASSRCLGGVTAGSHPTQYFLATANTSSKDRRDTLWHWWKSHADNQGKPCYNGNSHVKPMMQIIDSTGGFHGWVGVEASLNQSSPQQGKSADDIGIFRISEF